MAKAGSGNRRVEVPRPIAVTAQSGGAARDREGISGPGMDAYTAEAGIANAEADGQQGRRGLKALEHRTVAMAGSRHHDQQPRRQHYTGGTLVAAGWATGNVCPPRSQQSPFLRRH